METGNVGRRPRLHTRRRRDDEINCDRYAPASATITANTAAVPSAVIGVTATTTVTASAISSAAAAVGTFMAIASTAATGLPTTTYGYYY